MDRVSASRHHTRRANLHHHREQAHLRSSGQLQKAYKPAATGAGRLLKTRRAWKEMVAYTPDPADVGDVYDLISGPSHRTPKRASQTGGAAASDDAMAFSRAVADRQRATAEKDKAAAEKVEAIRRVRAAEGREKAAAEREWAARALEKSISPDKTSQSPFEEALNAKIEQAIEESAAEQEHRACQVSERERTSCRTDETARELAGVLGETTTTPAKQQEQHTAEKNTAVLGEGSVRENDSGGGILSPARQQLDAAHRAAEAARAQAEEERKAARQEVEALQSELRAAEMDAAEARAKLDQQAEYEARKLAQAAAAKQAAQRLREAERDVARAEADAEQKAADQSHERIQLEVVREEHAAERAAVQERESREVAAAKVAAAAKAAAAAEAAAAGEVPQDGTISPTSVERARQIDAIVQIAAEHTAEAAKIISIDEDKVVAEAAAVEIGAAMDREAAAEARHKAIEEREAVRKQAETNQVVAEVAREQAVQRADHQVEEAARQRERQSEDVKELRELNENLGHEQPDQNSDWSDSYSETSSDGMSDPDEALEQLRMLEEVEVSDAVELLRTNAQENADEENDWSDLETESDSEEESGDEDGPNQPQSGAESTVLMYRALKPAGIRAEIGIDSEKAGQLVKGQVFEGLEEALLGGRTRVRMELGWVSLTSGNGKPLCVEESAVQHFLAKVPLLQPLKPSERDKIAEQLDSTEVSGSGIIMRQGEKGDSMYFVETGKCAAYIKGEKVASYGAGDWFGELALVTQAPRSATVRAIGRVRCLKLGYDVFEPYKAKCAAMLAERTEMYAKQQQAAAKQKAALQAAATRGAGVMYRALKPAAIRAGIEMDSDLVGSKLVEGEIFEALEQEQLADGRWRVRMSRGWVSLTSGSGRPLCVAEAAVQLFMQSVPLLLELSGEKQAEIAGCLEGAEFMDGEGIVVEGEFGDEMFFLEDGGAEALKGRAVVMKYARGDFFGELALLKHAKRGATVRAVGRTRCLKLGRSAFEGIAGQLSDVFNDRVAVYIDSGQADATDSGSVEESSTEDSDSEGQDLTPAEKLQDSVDEMIGCGDEAKAIAVLESANRQLHTFDAPTRQRLAPSIKLLSSYVTKLKLQSASMKDSAVEQEQALETEAAEATRALKLAAQLEEQQEAERARTEAADAKQAEAEAREASRLEREAAKIKAEAERKAAAEARENERKEREEARKVAQLEREEARKQQNLERELAAASREKAVAARTAAREQAAKELKAAAALAEEAREAAAAKHAAAEVTREAEQMVVEEEAAAKHIAAAATEEEDQLQQLALLDNSPREQQQSDTFDDLKDLLNSGENGADNSDSYSETSSDGMSDPDEALEQLRMLEEVEVSDAVELLRTNAQENADEENDWSDLETESDSEEESGDEDGPNQPQSGAESTVLMYRALKPAGIRAEIGIDSEKAGQLVKGQVFEGLEEALLGGRTRVRMELGWVSLTSGNGKPLCVEESAVQHFLAKVPLLQPLKPSERDKIAEQLDSTEVSGSGIIMRQGEKGDSMYFVETGKCAAYIKGEKVASYGAGDWFGELALVTQAPRSATVRAIGRVRCLKLGYDVFEPYKAKCAAMLAERTEMYAKQQQAAAKQKAALQAAATRGAGVMYRALKPAAIRAGIEMDSDLVGSKLVEGEIFEALEQEQLADGRWRVRMSRGWVSLTSGSGRPLCVAEAAVQLFMQSVPLLLELSGEKQAEIAGCLEGAEFMDGEGIVVEGEFGDEMFFLEDGGAEALKGRAVVMKYARGDFFGELALLKHAKRGATVRAVGRTRCLKLGRSAFEGIAGQLSEALHSRGGTYTMAEAEEEEEEEEEEECTDDSDPEEEFSTATESSSSEDEGS